jgi:hypothetical protein
MKAADLVVANTLIPKLTMMLTGKNISSANISVKEGRPAFTGIADDVAEVGSSGKGTFKTKTNLFKKSAGRNIGIMVRNKYYHLDLLLFTTTKR